MPCPDVCHARNGEASTAPQDPAGLPIVYQEASNMIRTTVIESLEDCKLQVAKLARDETHLEVELHSIGVFILHVLVSAAARCIMRRFNYCRTSSARCTEAEAITGRQDSAA